MQVFNEINARKLKREETNVFEGFCVNPLFVFIVVSTIIVQMLIVEYGGYAMKVSPLSLHEHIVCILIASTILVVQYLIKMVPDELFACMGTTKEAEGTEEEEKDKAKKKQGEEFKFRKSQSIRSQKSKHSEKSKIYNRQQSLELREIKL